MRPRKPITIAATIACAILMATTTASATTVSCQRAIAKAGSRFVQTKVKALSKCNGAVIKNGSGACPDEKTAAAITKASTKLSSAIAKSCGGDDKVCGGDLTNEDTPESLGWPAFCPDFDRSAAPACTGPINNCGDIAACVECVGESAVDQSVALYYDDLALPSTSNAALNKCQTAIGKAASAFLSSKTKALQKCWDARLNGEHSESCAPPADGDGEYLAAIAKAETKKSDTIAKACTGFTPTQIGFTPNCPTVTVPDGDSCGGAITTLGNLNTCVGCVTKFNAAGVDQLQVPQYIPSYPAEFGACSAPAPRAGSACPTTMEFNADGQKVDLDTGWAGRAHNATLPSNGRFTLAVSGCDDTSHPNCGECDVNGPLENAGGVIFNNHRCQDGPWVPCTNDLNCSGFCSGGVNAGEPCLTLADCPDQSVGTACSGNGPCIFFFGAPQPLGVGGVGVCRLNKLSGPITGTLNLANDSLLTKVTLSSDVYIGDGEFDPCPQCNAGLCANGPRIGLPCSVNGTGLFGDVSLDCPPERGANVGTLRMTWDLATGPQTRALSTANPKCRQTGYTGLRCFCDTCNEANQTSCSSDLECPTSGGGPGICGGQRCLGGNEEGKPCNTCIGGTNHGASCSNVSQCPGGACPIGCAGVCIGGTNDGGSCSVSSSCPGYGGHCSGQCNIPGEPTQPNACFDDTSTPALEGCQDIGNNEGECAYAPVDRFCSIQKQHSCSTNGDCAPKTCSGGANNGAPCVDDAGCPGGSCWESCPECLVGQTCVAKQRSCFTDNGVIDNSVSVAGNPDAPCGGVAKPTVGALFCVPPVWSSAANAASGLPGLGRVRIPGTVVIGP